MKLSAQLLRLAEGPPLQLGFSIGVVTDDSPLTVQLNGDPTDIVDPPLIGAVPTIGDVVFCLRPGGSVVVLGATGTTTVIGGGGADPSIPYHRQGAGWTTTSAEQKNDYAAELDCVVPSEGNLFVWMQSATTITWVASPADASFYATWNMGIEVDGNVGSGFNTAFDQERLVTTANGTVSKNLTSHAVIACPAADTRVIKMVLGINADIFAVGHNNVASLEALTANIYALFVPGTAISDGGDFTP